MPDTYLVISQVSADPYLRARVASAYAKEQNGPGANGAENWAFANAYWWASAPGWAEAYEYAQLTGNENPGSDATVITDAMILAQVQLMLILPPPPPEPEPPEPYRPEIDNTLPEGGGDVR